MTEKLQSDHWVDLLIREIMQWKTDNNIQQLHVDDMKTPSGRVHTGSLRGVLIHDIVGQTLQKLDDSAVSTYVFNDMDPMDGLPGYLDEATYSQHMGKPLYKIPVPPLDHSGIDARNLSAEERSNLESAANFAELYAFDFVHAFRKLGCTQEIVWSHELYESGQMDEAIRTALDSVDEMRKIYKEVADYELPERWYPFQVICSKCGKVGTTLVTDWDGTVVTYECQPNKVTWAVGCGNSGTVSPFGGTGKLLWKADWPAHWKTMGITVEGAGKDHTSAGGSRDMANAQCERVFNHTTPFDIPYEWILIRGAKMSSSKGIGTSAREFVQLFPATVGRFLFVSKHFGQVIDFDPNTMAIPDLFDEYDQAARIFWQAEDGDVRQGRAYELSQIGTVPEQHFLPRFRDIALWMQHPEINMVSQFGEIKGAPLTTLEEAVLTERQTYAQLWLDRYAPDEYQLRPRTELPEAAKSLSEEQIVFLQQAVSLAETVTDPAELQQQLFDTAKATLGARKAFTALYLAFLGKTAGPRAAWFLLSVPPELRQQRVEELEKMLSASSANTKQQLSVPELHQPEIFSISPAVAERYPSVSVGLAIIRGITVAAHHPELEREKQELVEQLTGITTETISTYPELLSYRKLYKETGIDWHSRRPSPEALLRRLAQGKELYSINTCADAYNLSVIRHHISVGAFNLSGIKTPTRLDFANGSEEILLHGNEVPIAVKAGELCYFDAGGPYNLDFNYRDAKRGLVDEQTTDIMLNVDGVFDATPEKVALVLEEVIARIIKYCGGTVETYGIVTP